MKIRFLFITIVLLTLILCSDSFVGAQSVGNSALIVQLQAQIASLKAKIKSIQAAKQEFSKDSVYLLDIKKPIYGLNISADINFKSDKSLVRVILLDTKGSERLVYEAYPLIADSNSFIVSNVCQETCALDAITPSLLKIQVVDATISIKNVSSIDSFKKLSTDIQAKGVAKAGKEINKKQELFNIAKLNAKIKNKGLGWVAGETSVSSLSYEQKKKLFKNPDGTPATEPLNLQGFEYYKGGVFALSSSSQNTTTKTEASTDLPSSWDWRNVSGENWNSPVKDQGRASTCAFFGSLAALESSINLYYNQHLDVDLSEMSPAQCGYGSNNDIYNNICLNIINASAQIICQARDFGIPDESSYPYNASSVDYQTCNINPDYTTKLWGTTEWEQIPSPSSFINFILVDGELVSYNDALQYGGPGIDYYRQLRMADSLVKSKIIKNGPLVAYYNPWAHVVAVEGWGTDVGNSMPYWIVKNSWGSYWGESGYGKISITNLDDWSFGVVVSPITLPSDHSSWPAGFDGSIKCVDRDNDDYCNWGISEQKPNTCPESCKLQKDCDDSNYNLGPFDANFNCSVINAPPIINGTCGSANDTPTSSAPTTNLCSQGAPSAVSGSGPWTWTCLGSGGGTSAPCQAPKINTLSVTCSGPTYSVVGYLTTWSANPSGRITNYTYTWSGDDGLTGNTSQATKTYTSAGTKSATVTVTDPATSQTATATCSTTVNQSLSATCFASPSSPELNQSVTWTAIATGGPEIYDEYLWSGDVTGTYRSVTNSFATPGIKSATVTVTDHDGVTAHASCSASVIDPGVTPPVTVTLTKYGDPIEAGATITKGSTYTINWSVSPDSVSQSATQFYAEYVSDTGGPAVGIANPDYSAIFPVDGQRRRVTVTIPTASWWPAGQYHIRVWGYAKVNGTNTFIEGSSSSFNVVEPVTAQVTREQMIASISSAIAQLWAQVRGMLGR